MQPLALLASELKLIAEKELTQFYPILRQFSPEAGISSALKLHNTFGERLVNFLKYLFFFFLFCTSLVVVSCMMFVFPFMYRNHFSMMCHAFLKVSGRCLLQLFSWRIACLSFILWEKKRVGCILHASKDLNITRFLYY